MTAMTKKASFDGSPKSLAGSGRDFRSPPGSDFHSRTTPLSDWIEARKRDGVWSYGRSLASRPGAKASIKDANMKEFSGLNFGSQDYLNLSTHPEVVDAAIKAIQDYGVHSSGSGILMGNTDISIKLENAISDHLQATDTQLFPTGWGAGFGVVSGLVRPDDHVVLDVFAHSCLQEGAMASTKNVHRFRHLDNDDLRRVLSTIRASDTANAVMVITEGLFSMHADAPDLRTVQDLCHEFDATLVVDVAHDLGSTGPGGTGQIGIQGMVGKIDIVMGSFSKTFASNGGFVATKSRSLRNFIQVFASTTLFTNALSPSVMRRIGWQSRD